MHSTQSKLCSQIYATVGCKASGLHRATTLPQSSGTSAEIIKAVISMYEERRKSKAESNGKPVPEFVCITSSVWTQRAKSLREVGKEAEPFYLSTEGLNCWRGINPHSVRIFGSERQQVTGSAGYWIRHVGNEWVSLPDYKRKNCLEGYKNFTVLKA